MKISATNLHDLYHIYKPKEGVDFRCMKQGVVACGGEDKNYPFFGASQQHSEMTPFLSPASVERIRGRDNRTPGPPKAPFAVDEGCPTVYRS